MRQGSRAALSPPARASGSSEPTRAQRAPSSAISSPPQDAPSAPKPCPSSATPSSGPLQRLFGGDRRDVGHMVLDRHDRQARRLRGPRRNEIGMKIANRAFGLDFENAEEMPDGLVAETDGFAVVEIADVL